MGLRLSSAATGVPQPAHRLVCSVYRTVSHRLAMEPHDEPPARPAVPIAPMHTEIVPPALVQFIQREMAEHKATLKRDIEDFRRNILTEVSKRQKLATEGGKGKNKKVAAAANAAAAHAHQHLNTALATITEGGANGDGGQGKEGAVQAISEEGGTVMVVDPSNGERSMQASGGGSASDKLDKHKDVPNYELSLEVKSVRDLYVEWLDGWKGGPSVKDLNEKFESRWRKTDKARQRWCRREAVYRELTRRAKAAFSKRTNRPSSTVSSTELIKSDYEEAVAELDTLMTKNSFSLNKLAEYLKKPERAPTPPGPPLPLSAGPAALLPVTSHHHPMPQQPMVGQALPPPGPPPHLPNPMGVSLPTTPPNPMMHHQPSGPLLPPPLPSSISSSEPSPSSASVSVLPPMHHLGVSSEA